MIHLEKFIGEYGSFHEGLAAVVDHRTSKIGYIDKNGRYAIAPWFDRAEEFSEGRAAISIMTEDATGWPVRKWGFIDKAGTIVIPVKYESVGSFSQGLARVELGGKGGFIDATGRLVIDHQFHLAEPFSNGLALVEIGQVPDMGWSGYIDKTGQYVWRPSNYKELDQARYAKEHRIPTIPVSADPDHHGKALLVTCTHEVENAGPHAGELQVTVVNYLPEEVFLEVTGFDELGGSFETRDGGFTGGGGAMVAFPDNVNLLKRLHAAIYKGNTQFVCGCAVAHIRSKLAPNLMLLGPARGHVDVWVTGFYRKTGKAFGEEVEVPVEIVGETKGSGPEHPQSQPSATKPTTGPGQ